MNGPKTSTEKQKLSKWIKKKRKINKTQKYAAYKKHTLHIKTTYRWKVKGERQCANTNPEKAEVAVLISHKAYLEEGRLSGLKKDIA